MNRVKRTARKRSIRLSINKAKLEGREVMKNKGVQVQTNQFGNVSQFVTRDNRFAAEVAAKQPMFTIETPAEYRRRIAQQV